MPGAGIVDGDIGCRKQPGMQHRRILDDKAGQPLGHQPHDLALGDVGADIVETSAAPSSPVLARATSGKTVAGWRRTRTLHPLPAQVKKARRLIPPGPFHGRRLGLPRPRTAPSTSLSFANEIR